MNEQNTDILFTALARTRQLQRIAGWVTAESAGGASILFGLGNTMSEPVLSIAGLVGSCVTAAGLMQWNDCMSYGDKLESIAADSAIKEILGSS